jgi:hypothetical protein
MGWPRPLSHQQRDGHITVVNVRLSNAAAASVKFGAAASTPLKHPSLTRVARASYRAQRARCPSFRRFSVVPSSRSTRLMIFLTVAPRSRTPCITNPPLVVTSSNRIMTLVSGGLETRSRFAWQAGTASSVSASNGERGCGVISVATDAAMVRRRFHPRLRRAAPNTPALPFSRERGQLHGQHCNWGRMRCVSASASEARDSGSRVPNRARRQPVRPALRSCPSDTICAA